MANIVYPILRGKLAELGYTYKTAAKKCGISESSFTNKMLGKRPWMFDEIVTLTEMCGVPFETLFTR